MIYTVTLNPALDYIVSVDDFRLGKTNRTTSEQMLPGGKGVNVSSVLHNLGIESTALGFLAGFVGEELLRRMQMIGFRCDFIFTDHGTSRINLKMKNFDGTEINGRGPDIDSHALDIFFSRLDQLQSGDILVLSGSIPACLSPSIYRDILQRLSHKNILFVVDATKDLLINVLEYHPFLIKPNIHELSEIFHTHLTSKESTVPYAQKLQHMGARNVLVSMGRDGAVLLTETGNILMLPAPEGRLVNAVGAGDSMVAGFLCGWLEKHDYEHAFKMAVCAGSASAFSDHFATKEEIRSLYRTFKNS